MLIVCGCPAHIPCALCEVYMCARSHHLEEPLGFLQ